jgi:hypothetical protein
VLQSLIARIFERYPAAVDFDPCECGITLAVIPRDRVDPELHFRVDDEEFRVEALRLINEHELPNARYADGVLILGERA